jgi:hypothetical protein
MRRFLRSSMFFLLCMILGTGLVFSGGTQADITVSEPEIDSCTGGDFNAKNYGECFFLLANPHLDSQEEDVGPDCYSEHPEEYTSPSPFENKSNVCFGDSTGPPYNALPVESGGFSVVDFRVYRINYDSDENVIDEYDIAFAYSDIAGKNGGQYQFIPCETTLPDVPHRFTTFDSNFHEDKAVTEIKINHTGSMTLAYYFVNPAQVCRVLWYDLFINDVLMNSYIISDFQFGKYLVFDIDGLNGPATIRLETILMPRPWKKPMLCGPTAPYPGLSAHISGVFISNCVSEPPPPVCSIGDYVWEDANRNGCQDPDEHAIEEVEVKLFEMIENCQEPVPTDPLMTMTNADGYYEFTGLDCTKSYKVKFGDAGAIYTYTEADSCFDSNQNVLDDKDSDCSDDGFSGCITFPDPVNEPHNPTIDCGYVCGGKIGNYVWLDENENGCQDEIDTGIEGVDVTLYEGCPPDDEVDPKTVKTNTSGYYEFVGLCPGQYFVEFGNGRHNTYHGQTCDSNPDESEKKDSNCGDEALQCVELTPDNNTVDMTIDCGKVGPCLELEKQVSVDGEIFKDADNCTDADVPVTADNAEYKLIVTNCGKEAVTLNRIVDQELGINLELDSTNPITIQPGESVTFTNKEGPTKDLLQKEVDCPTPDGTFDNTATVYGTGTSGDPVEASDPACVKCPSECGLTVIKTCEVIEPEPEPFVCDDKIDALKMIWNGPGTLQSVTALPGGPDSFPKVSITEEGGQQVVTVVDYQPSTNDVIWEWQSVTDSGTNFGQSEFHLSCSDVEMDGETDDPAYPQDCARPEGNGKSNEDQYDNVWLLDGLTTDKGFVLDCTPLPAEPLNNCEFEAPLPPNCETLGKPTSLTFRYTGADCSASSNNQGDKSDCTGVPGSEPINITILKDLSKITVSPNSGIYIGDLVTVSAIGTDMGTEVQLDVGGQFLKIHTSCSAPLAVGDVFGSLELVQFNGLGSGAEVTYHYKVENIGDVPVDVTSVFDDQLGELLEGTETLGVGESYMLEKTVLISETITNEVTVKANLSGTDIPCREATDQVTVTVVEPTCDVSIVLDGLEDDKIKWKITNISELVATLETLTVNFPVDYGLIKEVKLDGTIYKDSESSLIVGPGVPITESYWTNPDVSKRQLDPSETRTLEVVFTQKSKGGGWVDIASAGTAIFKEGCEVELIKPSGCDIGNPTALVFRYTGEGCVDGNDQASDKWSCSGDPDGAYPVQVVMTKDVDKFTVVPEDEAIGLNSTFEIRKTDGGDFPAEIQFDIRQEGETLQSLTIHTSCSQPLRVGDQFGSVIVTEFIPNP